MGKSRVNFCQSLKPNFAQVPEQSDFTYGVYLVAAEHLSPYERGPDTLPHLQIDRQFPDGLGILPSRVRVPDPKKPTAEEMEQDDGLAKSDYLYKTALKKVRQVRKI